MTCGVPINFGQRIRPCLRIQIKYNLTSRQTRHAMTMHPPTMKCSIISLFFLPLFPILYTRSNHHKTTFLARMASMRHDTAATTTLSPPKNHQQPNGEDSNKEHRGPFRLAGVATIRWLESLRVPRFLARAGTPSEGGGTPVISGLERVVFGTQPACETVKILGVSPPRYLCYMVSGFLCDLIQFGIDVILHKVFLLEDASLCWALGFGASVTFRHTSHRYLVFGDYVGGFWKSLGRMYAGYSIIIVLSTIFNFVMTHHLQLPHYVAWIVTLLWTGIVNYFILKKLWSFGGKEKQESDSAPTSLGEGAQPADLEMQARTERKLQARKTDKR